VPETAAMRYGGGARLDMESLLLRGFAAPERRPGINRSAQRKRPTVQADDLSSGALVNSESSRKQSRSAGWVCASGDNCRSGGRQLAD
jgi:hypothetical protein